MFEYILRSLFIFAEIFQTLEEMWHYYGVYLRRSHANVLIDLYLVSLLMLFVIFFLPYVLHMQTSLDLGWMQEHIKYQGSHEVTAQWTHVYLRTFILLTCALCCHGILQSSHSFSLFFLLSINSVTFMMAQAHWSAAP